MRPPAPRSLPPWLAVVVSGLLLYHLAAIFLAAVDAPSGPWLGLGQLSGPQFAHSLAEPTNRTHLRYLRVAAHFRYLSDRPGFAPTVRLEAHLKDADGQPLKDAKGEPLVLRLPDKNANPWVRHRQELLVSQLADDIPVQQLQGEIIAAPGQKVPEVAYWTSLAKLKEDQGGPPKAEERRQLFLRTAAVHLLPRDPDTVAPSEWEMVLVRSYVRHLCRRHGAASVELVRRWRTPIPGALLFMDIPEENFEEWTSHFGEVRP